MQWLVRKINKPTAPDRRWIAYPQPSRNYGQRFPTWRAAYDYANARAHGKPAKLT